MNKTQHLGNADVIIVGGGLAAMHAALMAAKEEIDVVVITKKPLGRSGASVVSSSVHRYSPNEYNQKQGYKKNIIEGGRYINNVDMVSTLVEEGSTSADMLGNLGAKIIFKEVTVDGKTYRNFASANPRKGIHITSPMAGKVRELPNVKVLEGYMAADIVVQNGIVRGVVAEKDNMAFYIAAKSVVLATGGAAWLYSQSSGTKDLTGDGYAMAKRAGLALMDMEFIQFYPYRICSPSIHDIFPETFSHGAILVNEKGNRFMESFPKKESENRDTVARQMYKQNRVFLDLKNVDVSFLKAEGGDLYDLYTAYPNDLYEIKPVAHFTMGGVSIKNDCSTDLKGLFCCGEAAGGLHGANRLAGQALTETAVFGGIAGNEAAKFARHEKCDKDMAPLEPLLPQWWPAPGNHSVDDIRGELRTLMWEKAGIVRTVSRLAEAKEQIEVLSDRLKDLRPCQIGDWVELMNMLDVAKSIVESCLCRRESRGSHYLEDFPSEDADWLGNVYSDKNKTYFIKKQLCIW